MTRDEAREVVRRASANLERKRRDAAMQKLEEKRTYATMAGKSIGKCASGHWLPLSGSCDLCGAGPDEKCLYQGEPA